MKTKYFFLVLLNLPVFINAAAQNNKTDSLQVAKTLSEVLSICRNVDFSDTEVQQRGTFYKAAPYIIYRGDDKTRNWKDFANYNHPDEKRRVDELCEKIKRTANQDSTYSVIKYFTETESEGTWHILLVRYKKKGVEKTTAFAFLKIKEKFGLGDID